MRQNLNTALVLLTLGLGFGADRAVVHVPTVTSESNLQRLPMRIGRRTGFPEVLPPEVLSVLRPDAYLLRQYRGDDVLLTLFMAYYAQQRPNQRIHSPSVCLPAGGWSPIEVGYQEIPIVSQPGVRVTANRYLIEKGPERQVVLYWFQGRGRAIADDAQATVFLAYDTLRGRGSDETLVRLNEPVRQSVAATLASEVHFVQALYPELSQILAAHVTRSTPQGQTRWLR
jgi:EpsI family protein